MGSDEDGSKERKMVLSQMLGVRDGSGRNATKAEVLAVVAKRQNWWVGNGVGRTSLVETFHFRKQFSVSQPCGAGC